MSSPTSLNALESAKRRAPTHRQRVLHVIASAYSIGATDEEISKDTNLDLNTVRPRRGSLAKDGLIVDSGRTRKTKSGHDATLWRLATAEEREAFEAKRADRELESLAQAVADAQRNLNALRERWRQAIEEGARRAEVRT